MGVDMSQVQEFIVYRNPGEKAIWDALNGDFGVWMFVVIVGFFAGVAVQYLIERMLLNLSWVRRRIPLYYTIKISKICGGIAGFAVLAWLVVNASLI